MRYVRKVMAEWDREGQLATAVMTGEARGEAKGLAAGRAEGRTEGIVKTAKAMKAEGIPADVISRCTGLTPEQIEAL